MTQRTMGSLGTFGVSCITFGLLLAAGSAHAQQSITVPNAGFESPATTSFGNPAPWTAINGTGSYNPYEFNGGGVYFKGATPTTDPANGGAGYPGIQGENLGFAYNAVVGAGFSQTLTTTFAANSVYILTVAVGNRDGAQGGGTISFAGSTIQLLAGSTVVASNTNTVGPAAGQFFDQTATLTAPNTFAALAGQQLTVKLLTTQAGTSSNTATDWDNVRLVTFAAPEPASVGLLVLGVTGLVVRRRRK